MKRFKNILYVIDASDLEKQSGGHKVAELARFNEASVTIMIAEETSIFDQFSQLVSNRGTELKKKIHEHYREVIEQLVSHKRWHGLDVSVHDSFDNNFIRIIQKVMRDGHDLVIKEERLETGVDSLAMHLVRKCPVPIWVVKGGVRNFKSILGAIDVGSPYPEAHNLNQKIVELTYSLAQREQGEAHYVHAWRLENEAMLRGPRLRVNSEEIEELKNNIRQTRTKEMRDILERNYIETNTGNMHIAEGSSEKIIREMIEKLHIDVVVMGSVGRSGIPGFLIGNSAERILKDISCTVLTVKPEGFISPVHTVS